ncbi:hypothetical protein P879_01703 [Paragonimus westermani]|uniref:Uncharacterized protein n=1 Tax=Paragonimus westermani TaxID=34504 RepID=A0A8T0DTL4_9TREM|nr:hypothetical protein P879_01703 [Paragonimus westermani]
MLHYQQPIVPISFAVSAHVPVITAKLRQAFLNLRQPTSFSQRCNEAETRYCTSIHELVAVYRNVHFFRQALRDRNLVIFTGRILIVYVLGCTAQFLTDIQHITEATNVTVDNLSKLNNASRAANQISHSNTVAWQQSERTFVDDLERTTSAIGMFCWYHCVRQTARIPQANPASSFGNSNLRAVVQSATHRNTPIAWNSSG